MTRKERRRTIRPSSDPNVREGELRFGRTEVYWTATFGLIFSILLIRNYSLGEPYIPSFNLGPLTFAPFGPLVVLGIFFGMHLVEKWDRAFGLDWEVHARGLTWIVLLGFIISHFVSIIAYFPEEITNWRAMLDIRANFSSFGGIFGGLVVSIIFLRRNHLPLLPYLEATLFGFIGGWIFGRLGCFSVHDHPGTPTNFFLGINFRGAIRHDLGLYEMLIILVMFGILFVASRRKRFDGFLIGVACLIYSPARFLFDYLRIEDIRYLGLTPGQWLSITTFMIGLSILVYGWRAATIFKSSPA